MSRDPDNRPGVLGDDALERRLGDANPVAPSEPSVDRRRYEGQVRDAIVAVSASPRKRWRSRRAIAIGAAAALLASAAISAAVFTRSAPDDVKAAARLDPASIPQELRPIAGTEPNLLVYVAQPSGTFEVWGSKTKTGTSLVHIVRPGPAPRAVATSGCPSPTGALRVCEVSHGQAQQTVVGRVRDGVARVETVGLDGVRTPATLESGFFLSVIDGSGSAAADRVEALDDAGRPVSVEKVTVIDEAGNVIRP